ncbi:MAG TPA: hypothetical protein VEK06_00045 [Myxococcota bacterium]|nr:hypothetical protein [Myxococcota bacterium]
MKKIAFGVFCLFMLSFNALSELSVEDRLFDNEAQISALKEEISSLRNLAEQERPNAFNPSISVIGDLLGQYGFGMSHHDHDHDDGHGHGHDHEFHNGVFVREIEIEFRGDISPGFDSLIALAFEQHSMSDFGFHIEEAYARYKGWPVEIRAGRFKAAIGRMNRLHRHNLPQISTPLAIRRFLGEEGYASQGISLSGTQAVFENAALSLVVEGVMGSRLPTQEEGAEKIPNAVVHAWWHQQLSLAHYFDLGASGLVGRQGEKGSGALWLFGGDLHYSYIPTGYGQDPIFLFGLESLFLKPFRKDFSPGGFAWAQTRLLGSSFLGLRYDIAPKEEELNHFEHALGVYLGYYFSEFLRLRGGYEHVMPSLSTFKGDHRFMLSLNFLLGSHPAEPYFANR